MCDLGNMSLFKDSVFYNVKCEVSCSYVFSDLVTFIFRCYIDRVKLKKSSNVVVRLRKDIGYSTKKLYRQKGTGRARVGSKKSPIIRGGAASFIYKSKYRKLGVLRRRVRLLFFYVLLNKRAYVIITLMFVCQHKFKKCKDCLSTYLRLTKAINLEESIIMFSRTIFCGEAFFDSDILKMAHKYIIITL